MSKTRQQGTNSPIEEVLFRLENVKKTRNGWSARCPCHKDRKSSLAIALGEDGRVLLYCFAGCAFNNILGALGLEASQLFENHQLKEQHREPGSWKQNKIIKTYDYTDEKGNLLYQVCRTPKKDFPLRRPDGKGGWTWGLKGTPLVLYRLPSVLEAVNRGELLFLVEGEKDADRLVAAGLFATTNPLGCGKWKALYNSCLQGAKVAILPDNDKPGKQHAQQIAEQVQSIAASVNIVHLPGLQEKEDVSDWLDKYGTINELLLLTQNKEAQTDEECRDLTFLDLEKLIGPIEWVWKGWLPAGLLAIVASEPGIGKSALGLRLSATVISGLPWPDGSPYTGPLGSVLWCEAEAAQAINLERAKQWGIPLDKIKLPPLGNPLIDVQLDNQEHRNAVKKAASKEDVRLIVVDSLRGCHRLDENASESIEIVMWLAKLARDTGKPILLTHHLRKRNHSDGDSVSLDRLRGSSAIIQPARLIWAMDTPDIELPDHKRLAVIKSNLDKFPPPIGFVINGYGPEFGEAPKPPQKDSLFQQAKERLLAMLHKAPQPANELFEALEAEGISKKTAYRAKKCLKIVVFRKDDKWFWSLPFSENSVR
jgi:putative DNA primase/helicase